MIKTRVLHDGLHLSGVACGVYQGFPMVNGDKNPLSRGGCNSPGKGIENVMLHAVSAGCRTGGFCCAESSHTWLGPARQEW